MTPDQLEERLQLLAREVGEFSNARSGRTPREFATWFWHRAEDIKAEAGPELAADAQQRIADIADSALDAGLFGTTGGEDTEFPAEV
ncbi:hypothetical protein [uncultured Luteimonas sp.]|uniref:hypothetical protein n=1 Tax=uncultured Luteimonas sp. TaxID=453144 RepID=UPI00262D6725|nr:hypothetical protein [uncultured Luteimonas sp.]